MPDETHSPEGPYDNVERHLPRNSKGDEVGVLRLNLEQRRWEFSTIAGEFFETEDEAWTYYHQFCDPETGLPR